MQLNRLRWRMMPLKIRRNSNLEIANPRHQAVRKIDREIVRMNRRGGPEGVIDAVESRAPDGFSNIDDVLSLEQRKAIVRGYASTAGYAREQVNKAA